VTAFTVRITVRGTFADLSADQRADLLADADAHDILEAEYTAKATSRTSGRGRRSAGGRRKPAPRTRSRATREAAA
jgi:hypothetical protein